MDTERVNPVKYSIADPQTVETTMLEVLDYAYHGRRDIEITIEQPEFTSVCPRTGLPDFGRIFIRYRPGVKIVELKSIKFYLLQYRQVGIFYEHVVNRILDDLCRVLQPKQMEVCGEFTARGGITTRVKAVYEAAS